MKKKMVRYLGSALCASGLLVAGSASAHSFFFNYGHTPVYTEFDSEIDEDLRANTFEFGTYITNDMRAGLYHEQLTGGDTTADIQGISVEYEALATGDLMTNLGIMVGSGSTGDETSMIADVYGRVALMATESANINAKLAYRTVPDSDFAQEFDDGTDASDLHGILFSIGFGIHF
ncbi:hypothetical protein HH1059_17750 [Halorhodospira halochloris]|uniref:Outer membrane protein beta-barrel domain-containing protein n=1 Tax=Halorhodospira halochloris TaxID=1052 RepID=A0A0X8XAF9_HALHR|nr:hypothetical protein [Halorhodospira halochloris]MBK1651601.1 hypothetical protein [Halorhodospira halochloris]BAU58462.1 hypothetical protein HH1059_17750 [Halorhodospira halochloris]